MNDLVRRLWPFKLTLLDVFLNLFRIHLGIFTGERVFICYEKEQATAQRPDVGLKSKILLILEQLRCREVKMARVDGGAHQLLEIVRHADEIPLCDAVLNMNASWVQITANQAYLVEIRHAGSQHTEYRHLLLKVE